MMLQRFGGSRPHTAPESRPAVNRSLAITIMLVIAASAWLVPTHAWAFESEVTSSPVGLPCKSCHGGDSEVISATANPSRKGPHGGYTTGTSQCESCHFTHDAPTDALLQPAQTIRATCELCHDGTGGNGVYGVIEARTGLQPGSTHRIEATKAVPSGSVTGTTEVEFSGVNGFLTCSDCHEPHDFNTVAPFAGDRLRGSEQTAAPMTNRLLRKRPGGSAVEIPVYGSSWCAACHGGSLGAVATSGRLGDHSVETETAGFSYANVARVAGTETTAAELGPLGGSNFGYVMPYPREPEQAGRTAICQQCHEDGRHVGDDPSSPNQITPAEAFKITEPDGREPSDTPRFQTFPHEGENARFLIERGDDLCTNCHPA